MSCCKLPFLRYSLLSGPKLAFWGSLGGTTPKRGEELCGIDMYHRTKFHRRIGSHTGSCLCYVQGQLLQSAVGRSTKVCYRQVAARHECCSASCERHEEVAYDHGLTHLLHSEMHWLDVADRVTYKLGVTVYKCLHGQPARHRIICLSCVHRSLKLLNDSIFVPPAAIYSLFHGFSFIRTAVAPSLSLDQRHGTNLVPKQFA